MEAAHTPCRTRTVSTVALATVQTFLLVALADAGKGPGTRVRTKKWHRHKKWHKMGDHPPKWHERGLIWFVIGFLLFLVAVTWYAIREEQKRQKRDKEAHEA